VRLIALFACASALLAAAGPRVEFTKSFPGSIPAYVGIWVDPSGKGDYKEAADDDQPQPFQLEPAETAQVFSLVEKLGKFSVPLESGLKVAFTGDKTFRYLDGATKNETKFNYTQNPEGQLLLDWFEKIAETSRHAINLERAARFDRLGVDAALLQLQVSFDQHRLAGARQLLPILDRIAKNKSAFNRARERAAAIAGAIRQGDAKPE
jgi:hypothetical protein